MEPNQRASIREAVANPAFGPLTHPSRCKHGAPNALVLRDRATVCMCCGIVTAGSLSSFDALQALAGEWAWHRKIMLRIVAVARAFHMAAFIEAGAVYDPDKVPGKTKPEFLTGPVPEEWMAGRAA